MENEEQKVFIRNEVLTRKDLLAIQKGYGYLYECANTEEEKSQFITAVGVIEQLIKYLDKGKIDITGAKRD